MLVCVVTVRRLDRASIASGNTFRELCCPFTLRLKGWRVPSFVDLAVGGYGGLSRSPHRICLFKHFCHFFEGVIPASLCSSRFSSLRTVLTIKEWPQAFKTRSHSWICSFLFIIIKLHSESVGRVKGYVTTQWPFKTPCRSPQACLRGST